MRIARLWSGLVVATVFVAGCSGAAPDGSDLDRPTFSYCEQAEAVPTGDDLRVARTQRWWSDDAFREGSPGGFNVSSEVVYYSGDGAQQHVPLGGLAAAV